MVWRTPTKRGTGMSRCVRRPARASRMALALPSVKSCLSREAARKRGVSDDQLPTSPPPGSAYIKVVPVKYISWDYSR